MATHTCMNGTDCVLCEDTMRRDFERSIYSKAELEDDAMAAELNQPASQAAKHIPELGVERVGK